MASIIKKIRFLRHCYKDFRASLEEKAKLYKIAQSCEGFHYEKNVQIKSPELLELGRNVVLQRNAVIHCGGFSWSEGKGKVVLGSYTVISSNAFILGGGGIYMNDFSHLGPGAMLISQSPDRKKDLLNPTTPLRFSPIVIGKGVMVGAGAVIFEGTKIGDFSSISPNAAVRGYFPEKSLIIGDNINKKHEFKDDDFFCKTKAL